MPMSCALDVALLNSDLAERVKAGLLRFASLDSRAKILATGWSMITSCEGGLDDCVLTAEENVSTEDVADCSFAGCDEPKFCC